MQLFLSAWILAFVVAVTPAAAGNLAIDDLLGRWCGDTTSYTFTRSKLIVEFYSGQPDRILDIDRLETSETWINVFWKPPYVNTIFSRFSPDKREMFQDANTSGDRGPERRFRRC
jgi:hypothetical protein